MDPLQTPSLLGGRVRAAAMAAVMLLLLASLFSVSLTEESDAADPNYNNLVTSASLTFHPNLDSIAEDDDPIAEGQRYSGKSISAVEWKDMADGVKIRLPVALPGTDIVTVPVSTYSDDGKTATLKGHYYLSGWRSSDGFSYKAGEEYELTDKDVVLYAQWTRIDASTHFDEHFLYSEQSFNYEAATATILEGESYTFDVLNKSNPSHDDNCTKLISVMVSNRGGLDNNLIVIEAPSIFKYQTSGNTLSFTSPNMTAGNYVLSIADTGAGSYVWWVVSVEPKNGEEYGYEYDTLVSGATPAGGTVRYGQAFDLSDAFVGSTEITNPDTTKSLVGWTVSSSSGTLYHLKLGQRVALDDALISFVSDGTLTFKGDWQSIKSAVVLSMDGASLRNVDAYVVDIGDGISFPREYDDQTMRQIQKQGKTLIGWAVDTQNDSTNGEALFAPGAMARVDSAVYKAEARFWDTDDLGSLMKVTYVIGDGSSGLPTFQYIPKGWFVYPSQIGVAAPEGYTFSGWATTEDGEAVDTTSLKVDADMTLYAVYKKSSAPSTGTVYHTVYLYPDNGRTGDTVQTVKDGGYVRQPAGVTRDGHILDHWMDNATGDAWDFSKDTVTKDVSLTAVWKQQFSYTVDGLTVKVTLYDPYDDVYTISWGDGRSDSATTEHTYASVNACTAGAISVTSVVKDPSGKDVSCTSQRTLTGMSGEFVPQKIVYTVTFNAYPGKFSDGKAEHIVSVGKGDCIQKPSDVPTYNDEHGFVYWARNGTEWDFSAAVDEDNIVLKAVWSDILIVKFDANWSGAEDIEVKKVGKGGEIYLPEPDERKGYVFKGWNTQPNGYGTDAGTPGKPYKPDRSRTLYGTWEAATSDTRYTISFLTGGGPAVDDIDVAPGESLMLPDPEWEGHEVLAWYLNSEKVGKPNARYTPTSSCTLTAEWYDTETGKTEGSGSLSIAEAKIKIQPSETGWDLYASGNGEFSWSLSSDGKRTWSAIGKGAHISLNKDDFEEGTYWIKLTAETSGGKATDIDSFTVGGGGADTGPGTDEEGILDRIIAFFSENAWAAVALLLIIAVVAYYARWML